MMLALILFLIYVIGGGITLGVMRHLDMGDETDKGLVTAFWPIIVPVWVLLICPIAFIGSPKFSAWFYERFFPKGREVRHARLSEEREMKLLRDYAVGVEALVEIDIQAAVEAGVLVAVTDKQYRDDLLWRRSPIPVRHDNGNRYYIRHPYDPDSIIAPSRYLTSGPV